MRVAITGVQRRIGRVLRERLSDRFVLRPLSRRNADITDLEAVVGAFDGMDAVVHLAANSAVRAAWDDLVGPNLVGAYHAFEAARRAGVRRLVFASTNHVMGMYMWDEERFAVREHPAVVAVDDPIRPDSLYGATKAWGARPSVRRAARDLGRVPPYRMGHRRRRAPLA